MSDDSEEKSLPASEQKLRKAREKGQVAGSSDFVTGVVVVVTILFLMLNWMGLVRVVSQLFNTSINNLVNVTPSMAFSLLLSTFDALSQKLSWLGFIIIITAICANIIHKRGIPFSMHPVTPDFTRINPAQGFTKLFSMRNMTEFGVSLLRLVVWFIAASIVLYLALEGFMKSVTCGGPCVFEQSMETGKYILIIALFFLIVAGLMDLPMQQALFQRDQRMGHKEAKRERKDTYGSAEFRNHRRSQYRELIEGGGSSGATFYLAGPGFLVGISFNQEESPVPKVVSRVREAGYEHAVEMARKNNIPILQRPDLAADIFRTIDVGSIIRERHFERVALILVQLKLIG